MTAPKWLKDYGLEPDLGRLIIAHSDQRELWVKNKRLQEPDLGRFTPYTLATTTFLSCCVVLNRPQPGSGMFFALPIVPVGHCGL